MLDNRIEDISKHFLALDHSVNIVNNAVALGDISDEILSSVCRNWKHIEIMLSKDFIINAGRDLSVYQDAIADGALFAPDAPVDNR